MSKAFAAKLIDVTENHAEEIARRWFKDVTKNARTPAYHNLGEEKLVPRAISFYTNFRKMFFSDQPYAEAEQFFSEYAAEAYRDKIPLHEALYALILMRRHIWLFAEFQVIFMTAVEYQQSSESLSRTILLFDYATYTITKHYEKLACRV